MIGVCFQVFLANVLRPYWRANSGGRKTSENVIAIVDERGW